MGVNTDTKLEYNNYIVSYNSGNKKYEANELYKGILCTAASELSTQKFYDIDNDIIIGEKTFYVLEDGDTTELIEGRIAKEGEVSLIMNMNIDENGKGTTERVTVAWCSDENLCKIDGEWDNTKGPITALRYLKNSISNWAWLSKIQVILPTYNQITQVNENLYYNLPTWLYENTATNDNHLRAYWTSDNDSNKTYMSFSMDIGIIYRYNIYNSDNIGVRPVITISKTQLV